MHCVLSQTRPVLRGGGGSDTTSLPNQLVIPHVDLSARFLGGPTQRTEGRELIARLHQGLDPHVDWIGENVLAFGGIKHRPHEDATTPVAKRVDVQMRTNQRAMPPAIAVRLVLRVAGCRVPAILCPSDWREAVDTPSREWRSS
jgi:hypothetical protein